MVHVPRSALSPASLEFGRHMCARSRSKQREVWMPWLAQNATPSMTCSTRGVSQLSCGCIVGFSGAEEGPELRPELRPVSTLLGNTGLVYPSQQLTQTNSKAARDRDKSPQIWDSLPALDEAHSRAVQPAVVGKGLLTQAPLCPQFTQSLPQCQQYFLHRGKSADTIRSRLQT